MWKSAYVGVYQLLNWKMHGETMRNMFFVEGPIRSTCTPRRVCRVCEP